MWDHRYLLKIDWRLLLLMLGVMGISLLVISSGSSDLPFENEESFFTPMVLAQLKWFALGSLVFLFLSAFDYNQLREWAWPLYILAVLSLVGLFFTHTIVGVRRWYRLPFINMGLQPSEYAKIILVITLSWFFERRGRLSYSWSTFLWAALIVIIPFILILRQPDLGTSLVVLAIALVMFYFGAIRPIILRILTFSFMTVLFFVGLIFLGALPHGTVYPIAAKVLKEYQLKRLDPNTHHQKAAATAIAVGGVTGTGWRKGELTTGGWLPAPYTDSVFPAFGEQFGLIGLFILMLLFYSLIHFCFQVTVVAVDPFGRLLSAGIAAYFAIHLLINIGMMCGFVPITGVPLLLVTYGGTSVITSMGALGVLQSIYSRRFMF